MRKIIPVLMSGGNGSRLWPLSREAYPKQLLPLLGENTLLQETARRVMDSPLFEPVMIIANAEHRFIIAEQLRKIGCSDARIVLEPFGRNTAPAAAIACILAHRQDPDSIVLLMPADHSIEDVSAFHAAVEAGLPAAAEGSFVLFGVTPNSPVTGYGYIHYGKSTYSNNIHPVVGFKEKPDRQTAEQYLASGEYAWNSGIFLLPAGRFLEELERSDPHLLQACIDAIDDAATDLDFLRLAPDAFARATNISIDHAVMEGTSNAVVVTVDFSWSDIGSWSTLHEKSKQDGDGTATQGDVITIDTKDCYIRSDGPLVGAVGVDNLLVVATSDAILVARKDRDQDVKLLVERLKAAGHNAALSTPLVHRPWGSFQSLEVGNRFQVKRITVAPGGKLSLQKHFHRAEHWVVVSGTALVTKDAEITLLRENESIYLPLGCMHRLENPGRVPLDLIEVQSGAYLGEDDIVRFEDVYARD
ncbi:mannose-1-phosphate guanylyltransferase/mannose-6-phosphate isomerase [Microvirga roseola]|uniref:mannose-1-phosphate guanylyltransferase/mannose-6-phosphate isomerase n=1 Tax=Microvirga roseola TaxID=2883126 RepID=UPI001E2EFB97|nr:mannose-1-phosphate guanylyltransferase/mannose-6-phosphate isomerase [Microvirga roseola]